MKAKQHIEMNLSNQREVRHEIITVDLFDCRQRVLVVKMVKQLVDSTDQLWKARR